jgi:solute carrier family 35 protein F1/2
VLAITNTATSTFSTLLSQEGTSIPAFQSFFNYVLLNLIFTPYTIYRYGFKGWLRLMWRDGWKYIILAFCDVEGNYFIVLAYRYTTMLSAQLINFWAIAVVVFISFLFLRVRYHITQILGILICIGGMGVLIASDHITGSNGGDISSGNQIKGDLFALLGASFYGLTNTGEEYFVSSRPVYEVLGQMAFFGMIINGVQAGIFDRHSFQIAVWNSRVGSYFTGYTLCLAFFYCMAPLLFRLSSAAFFNISLLTMNFWGVCIGIEVFHYHIHWMYPIAFVLIIVGQLIYFLGKRVLGESRKPWLGKNQERGFAGLFTAKAKIDSVRATLASNNNHNANADDAHHDDRTAAAIDERHSNAV